MNVGFGMWLRTISAVVAVASLLGAIYFGWAFHRASGEVLHADRQWPRPWPYPDEWIFRWERRIDAEDRRRSAERGDPPGLRIEGEFPAVQARLAGLAIAALAGSAASSIPLAVWYRRRRAARLRTGEAADYAEELPPDNGIGPATEGDPSPYPRRQIV